MLEQWSGGFDWDLGNWPKCGQHGVPRDAVEAVFTNDPLIVPDLSHSALERRFAAIDIDPSRRPVFVIFTIRHGRGRLLVRPISARYMHLEEVNYYAEAVARMENR